MKKVNPTVALTLVLLFLMVAAGFLSAAGGYTVGREALKGIKQPDARPATNLSDASGVPRREEVTILREADILADVKAQMDGNVRRAESVGAASPASAQTKATTVSTSPSLTSDMLTASPQANLPIVAQDQGVTLEVRSVRQQDGTMVMDVNLTNRGSQPVKFLYSFMNVTDNQGRSFSTNTEGLPAELPPNSESFSGTVSIPIALLEGSNNLALSLTDYPNQNLKLQLSGIPVVR
ncbi:MAG TPA: hypothetical protein V6C78_01320 [Crinalium sp.]